MPIFVLITFMTLARSATTLVQPMSRLVWHRRDLRLSDNEIYHKTHKVYSVFIFDPSDYVPRSTGIHDESGGQLQSVNHGPHFTRRLIDAVHTLRNNLRSLGGDLIVRMGNPLQIIPQLTSELQIEEVAWSEVPGYYECMQSNKLKQILQFNGLHKSQVITTSSMTLVHPDDLPTDPAIWNQLARPNETKRRKGKSGKSETTTKSKSKTISSTCAVDVSPSRFEGMPVIMGDFRRVARTAASPRVLFDYPDSAHIAEDFNGLDLGAIPTLDELAKPLLESTAPILGCLPNQLIERLIQSAGSIQYEAQNIEKQAMLNLQDFVTNHAASADRSLCDVSNHNSSMLSLPLALGTLSPRQVYYCVKEEQNRLEQNGGNSVDINWLISHMEMRDYFLFNHFRQGRSAYKLQPIQPVHKPDEPREWVPLSNNKEQFIRWASGQTGLPLGDAGMKELLTTGYTSNRVRQNMASVLTKDLRLDWRLGAEWYQLCLEDHCVAGKWFVFISYICMLCQRPKHYILLYSKLW